MASSGKWGQYSGTRVAFTAKKHGNASCPPPLRCLHSPLTVPGVLSPRGSRFLLLLQVAEGSAHQVAVTKITQQCIEETPPGRTQTAHPLSEAQPLAPGHVSLAQGHTVGAAMPTTVLRGLSPTPAGNLKAHLGRKKILAKRSHTHAITVFEHYSYKSLSPLSLARWGNE